MINPDEAIITGMDINNEWQLRQVTMPKQNNAEGIKDKKLKKP